MPIYQYRCSHCTEEYQDFRFSEQRDEPRDCPTCGTALVRSFTPPTIPKPYNEGINRATGKYTTSKSQLKEDLNIQTDINSERTGYESKLIMVDPADAHAVHGIAPPENKPYNGREHIPDEVKWLT